MNQGMVNSASAPINAQQSQFVDASGEGPSSYQNYQNGGGNSDFTMTSSNGMSTAANSRVVESI